MEKFPLQDDFLADMCQTQAQVSISLLNGVRLEGTIESSDQFTVLLKKNKDSQLIYKHLISSIVPLRTAPVRTEKENRAAPDLSTAPESTPEGTGGTRVRLRLRD